MRFKILILGLIYFFLISCKETPENPFAPEYSDVLKANVILIKNPIMFTNSYDINNNPIFGYNERDSIKNIGNVNAYDIWVDTILYDSNKNKLANKKTRLYQIDSTTTEGWKYITTLIPEEIASIEVYWLKSEPFYDRVDSINTKFIITWKDE